MSTSSRTALNAAANWPARSRIPEWGEAIAEVPHEVADLLGGPPAVRVRGRAQEAMPGR